MMGSGVRIPLAHHRIPLRATGTYRTFVRKLVASFLAFLTPSCHQVPRDFQIGASEGGGHPPGVTAIRALRMQKDQLQVGHTIHPSDSGRQASERPPCCHKESVAAYLKPNLAAREPMERDVERQQRQLCVSETSSSSPSIEAQLTLPACRRSCDRACGASRFGSSLSTRT